MSWLRRWQFALWYLRRPPWDSGITPPELREFIQKHPAGRALDLGCGTGTNTLALAEAGWQVTGVDFVPRALQQARRKAQAAGVTVTFLQEDVSRLSQAQGPFDLALDIGCFHGLPATQRESYLQNLQRILAPDGHWLLYLMRKEKEEDPGPGLTESEIQRLTQIFQLSRRENGRDPRGRLSCWLWFEKHAPPYPVHPRQA